MRAGQAARRRQAASVLLGKRNAELQARGMQGAGMSRIPSGTREGGAKRAARQAACEAARQAACGELA